MNDFTKSYHGFEVDNQYNIRVVGQSKAILCTKGTFVPREYKNNARLACASFNATNALANQGIDAIKAIELLAELISVLDCPLTGKLKKCRKIIAGLKGEQE